jgi:hydroxymethylglutaryl-CoA lyase
MVNRQERMSDVVKIVECPRDAWQGLPGQIAPALKAAYLRKLIDAGFTHIDAVSFVSPKAVPQMADSEKVLQDLNPPQDVEIIGIVVNEKGAQRAIATGAVRTLGFPYSISPEFLRRNQNQTQAESLNVLGSITELAEDVGLNVVAYISMAFGNPYGEAWSANTVIDACRQLIKLGIWQISLADTVGLAAPAQISETVERAIAAGDGAEIGVHLHARPQDAAAKVRAAYQAGCRRFDSAIGGLGGCPFAQDALVGNIPTEALIAELTSLGAQLETIGPLDDILRSSAEIAGKYGAAERGTHVAG